MTTWDDIERGLELYFELIGRDEGLRAEFAESQAEFFADPEAARTPGAELRHLEWFVLERPSAVLASVPAVALREPWLEEGGSSPEVSTSLLQSIPGAFEVTSLSGDQGLWVRDLFTQGELPVADEEVGREFEVGDLLVGRLFPAEGGAFVPSGAVSLYRSPELLAAIRADLGAMRAARRGVLRVQQIELERLFHGRSPAGELRAPSRDARSIAREGLHALGLADERVEDVLRRVRAAARAGKGDTITDILNGFAFDTAVDLERARIVLVELWEDEREALATKSSDAQAADSDARAALDAFDRGRAEGKDLELLFRNLERDLGLEHEEPDDPDAADGEDSAGVPDFPGVVGAIVEEFLWDVERERGPELAARWSGLRRLGQYARDVGVLEELGAKRLLDFGARWLLDEGAVGDAGEAATILEALAEFCAWAEERHDVPLRREFGPTLARLVEPLGRHVELRKLRPASLEGALARVVAVEDGSVRVSDLDGEERAFSVGVQAGRLLRTGDFVRVGRRGELGAAYPGELAGLAS